MIARRKTRLLLFGLLGLFAFVAFTQWLSAPGDPGTESLTIAESAPNIDSLDTILLLYADALAHVATRYVEAESYETATLLLKRVARIRTSILGPEHPSAADAQDRYAEALRAHEVSDAKSAD